MECNKLYYFILYSANFWAPRNFSPLVLSVLHIKTRDKKKKNPQLLETKRKKVLIWPGFEPAITDYWTDALDLSAILLDV